MSARLFNKALGALPPTTKIGMLVSESSSTNPLRLGNVSLNLTNKILVSHLGGV